MGPSISNHPSCRQAYALFSSPQAATAVKRKVETFGDGQVYKQKIAVSFSNPYLNPFKTVPKDGGNRKDHQMNRNYNSQGQSNYNSGSGYRGRGGYNNRGMNNVGGYNRGGFQQNQQVPMPGGYPPASGFQGNPAMGAGMQPYGNFQNRGGMMGGGPGMRGNPMGMRGGRGGMNGMMGMPMGMGPMPGQMPMGMPNGGMPMQGMHSTSTSASTPPSQRDRSASFGRATGAPGTTVGVTTSASGSVHAANAVASQPPLGWTSYFSPPRPYYVSPSTMSPAPSNFHAGMSRKTSDLASGFGNPGFFPQQQDANWNPHGAKRTRQE